MSTFVCLEPPRANLVKLVEHLQEALKKAISSQDTTTQQLAHLTALAGAEQATRWARMDGRVTAPTPSNFHLREEAFKDCIYVLNESQRE